MYNKCNVVLTSIRLFARKDWFSDSGGSRHMMEEKTIPLSLNLSVLGKLPLKIV